MIRRKRKTIRDPIVVEEGEPPVDKRDKRNECKYPNYRIKIRNKEPDYLLSKFMAFYNLDPRQYSKMAKKFIYVRSIYGAFKCHHCGNFWSSYYTWIRFDIHKMTPYLYGQKCRDCISYDKPSQYIRPFLFYYFQWREICLNAIDSKQY